MGHWHCTPIPAPQMCPATECTSSQAASRGPIAFGWVIDKAYPLWQDQCGQQGSCFVYQNSNYELVPAHRRGGIQGEQGSVPPQGHCGGGVGALESIPKSQESWDLGSPWVLPTASSPTGRGAWVSPLLLVPRRGSFPCSEWSLLGCDDLMPVEAMTGQQVQGLCPAHPHPPALWSPLTILDPLSTTPPPHPLVACSGALVS